MNCPECDYPESKVADSRKAQGAVWRRRQCLGCAATWTTEERANPSDAAMQAAVAGMVEAMAIITESMVTLKKMMTRGGIP